MTETIADLQKRVAALEHQVNLLRQFLLPRLPGQETPAEAGARMRRQAELNGPAWAEGWAWALEQMGIQGKPIPAEELQARIAAGGVKPADNEFSRTLIEMREE